MNIGNIAILNNKGQIVIPVKIRELVGIKAGEPVIINVTGQTIYLQPAQITPVLADDKAAFLDFLKNNRGFMADDPNFTNVALRKRKKAELNAIKRNAW